MQKIIFFFIAIFIVSTSIIYAHPDENAVDPFTWKKPYVDELQKAKIPVYVPTVVAASDAFRKVGPLSVSKLEASTDHYLFTISRQKKNRMLSVNMMTMSAGTLPVYRKQAFSTYEIFEKPEGTIHFKGYKIDYFHGKHAFIWKDNGWEYLVWAYNPNNAFNILKRIMYIIPRGTNPVQGAQRGQLTAIETKEGVITDAGWTYDNGRIWYILTGKSTPEQEAKILKSMVQLDSK